MVHKNPSNSKPDGFFVVYGFLGETGTTILKQDRIKPMVAMNATISGIMAMLLLSLPWFAHHCGSVVGTSISGGLYAASC